MLFTNSDDLSEVLTICLKGCLKQVIRICGQHTLLLFFDQHLQSIQHSVLFKGT